MSDNITDTHIDDDGYVTVQGSLEASKGSLKEDDVLNVFGGKVRVRELSAAQMSRIQQDSVSGVGRTARISLAKMEKLQFLHGVTRPKYTPEDVERLHRNSGSDFAKVIAAIDEMSGTGKDKDELKTAGEAFPEPETT